MTKCFAGAVAAVVVLASGCAVTAEQYCDDGAHVFCARLFRCEAGLAAASFTSEADCETQQRANDQCTFYKNITCENLAPYEKCLDDQLAADCDTTLPEPASCQGLNPSPQCQSSSGKAVCGATNVQSDTSTCSVSLSGCTDSNNYLLSCATGSNTCTCQTSGVTTKTFDGSSCPNADGAISTCSWNVEPN